jgi:hypothetical protein
VIRDEQLAWQAKQVRAEGHDPVVCGACGWVGYVLEVGATGAPLIRHLGRGFPCRADTAEPVAPTAMEALESP